MLMYLTSADAFAVALQQRGLILVLGYVDWCPYSLMMKHTIDAVSAEFSGVTFIKMPLDNMGYVTPAQIVMDSYPTIILLQDGRVLNKSTGYVPVNHVREMIQVAFTQDHRTIATKQNESVLGTTTVSLHVYRDKTKGFGRSRILVETMTASTPRTEWLDPSMTGLLLLFATAAQMDCSGALFVNGNTTKAYDTVLRAIRARLQLEFNSRLPGLTGLSGKEDAYISKQISRLNKIINQTLGRSIIIRNDLGYKIAHQVEIRIILDDYI